LRSDRLTRTSGQIGVDRGALQAFIAHAVDDGVLDALRGEAGMGDLVAGHVRVHRQGHLRLDVLGHGSAARRHTGRLLVRAIELDRPSTRLARRDHITRRAAPVRPRR
jgi:hypothetical protein